MNYLSYILSLSDAAILREIGAFIKATRIGRNLTQDEVACQAADKPVYAKPYGAGRKYGFNQFAEGIKRA